jgi:dTDP-4-dehydrorhamnose reductase
MINKNIANEIVIFGDGLLGSTIQQITGWDFVSRKNDKVDINNCETYTKFLKYYKQFLNCMACTDTYSNDFDKHWNTNYVAVINLVNLLNRHNKKLIHISTDYVYSGSVSFASEKDVPVHAKNWYSYTKLLGDSYVQAVCKNYLLIRCSFKPRPFPYDKGITNQIGNFDYADVVAEKIVKLIKYNAEGVYNVGTQMKTQYDLGIKTNPDIEPIKMKIHESMPEDITMNLSKMTNFLEKIKNE